MTKNESTLGANPGTSKKPTGSAAELAYVSTERYEPAGRLARKALTKLFKS
jgi:hypothetical protein